MTSEPPLQVENCLRTTCGFKKRALNRLLWFWQEHSIAHERNFKKMDISMRFCERCTP